jgi:hypothetical protein
MQKQGAMISKENGLSKRILQRWATSRNRSWRIVALEKVAGSIPVGHPTICRQSAASGIYPQTARAWSGLKHEFCVSIRSFFLATLCP